MTILIITLIVAIYRMPYFSIRNITLDGDKDERVTLWLDALKGKSIFSREVTNLTQRIENQNLFVRGLSCSRGLPDSLRCNLQNRSVGLVWKKQDKIYLVDDGGLVFAESQAIPGKIIVEDLTAVPTQLGSRVASREIVTDYQQIAAKLSSYGITTDKIVMPDTLLQVSVVIFSSGSVGSPPIVLAKPLTVMFNLAYSIDDQISSLMEILKQKGSVVTERVDLRVAGYIYYK